MGADEVGAWHRRKRIWIVAYFSNTNNSRHMDRQTQEQSAEGRVDAFSKLEPSGSYERDVSDTDSQRGCGWNTKRKNAENVRKLRRSQITGYWNFEPELGRVANGIPNRVDRLKGLGNAIVPQVAYEIMKRIK
jgi:DNA (cytosine-5)-methyltransferase 1